MSSYYCPACMGHHPERECPLVERLRSDYKMTSDIVQDQMKQLERLEAENEQLKLKLMRLVENL